MLTDTATHNSPWLCESVMLGHNIHNSLLDTEWIEAVDSTGNINRERRGSPTSSSCPSEVGSECSENLNNTFMSENSSECDDELQLDVLAELKESLFGEISFSIMNSLDTTEVDTDECSTDNFEWKVLDPEKSVVQSSSIQPSSNLNVHNVSTNHHVSSDNLTCQSQTSTQKKSLNLNNRKWSSLSEEDKADVIEDLSHVISNELGLREQLDVIRIINPTACISPTDTEFTIDIYSINEEKLRKIQEYIASHAKSQTIPDQDSNYVSRKIDNKIIKRQKNHERKSRQKMIKKRQQKEYKQMLKEKRSGLFTREEVLSVTEIALDDVEDDIDIIG